MLGDVPGFSYFSVDMCDISRYDKEPSVSWRKHLLNGFLHGFYKMLKYDYVFFRIAMDSLFFVIAIC